MGSNGLDPAAPYGPRRSWILFNEIYGSLTGIRVEGAADCWIVGNRLYDLAGNGITLDIDRDSDNIHIASNTIGSVGGDGIHHHWISGARNIVIENNIISRVGGRHVAIGSGLVDQVSMSHCLFHQGDGEVAIRWGVNDLLAPSATRINSLPGCLGNLIGDPAFIDAGRGDFRLQASSAAIDKGAEAKAYGDFQRLYSSSIMIDANHTTRPQGGRWDVGAFERLAAKPQENRPAQPDGS